MTPLGIKCKIQNGEGVSGSGGTLRLPDEVENLFEINIK